MNAARRTPTDVPVGPLVAAVGGIVLIVSLFLDWYAGLTGFTVFEIVDVLLLACALLMVARLLGEVGVLPPPLSAPTALGIAAFALLVVVVQLINDPPAVVGPAGASQDVGIWLALAGAALMLAGAVLSSTRISLSLEPRSEPRRPSTKGDTADAPTRAGDST